MSRAERKPLKRYRYLLNNYNKSSYKSVFIIENNINKSRMKMDIAWHMITDLYGYSGYKFMNCCIIND